MAFALSSLGSLNVVVVSACELKNRDGFFGKNDAYTFLKLGKQRGKTKIIHNAGSKATWNEEFTFQIYGKEDLEVICYDYDKITTDDIIGSALIPLNTLFEINYIENWFDLVHKGKYCGKIHLRISFTLARPNSPPRPISPIQHANSLSAKLESPTSGNSRPNSYSGPSANQSTGASTSYPPSQGTNHGSSLYPPPSSPPKPFHSSTQTGGYPPSPPKTSLYPPPGSQGGPPSPTQNAYPPSSRPLSGGYPPINTSPHSGGYPPMNTSPHSGGYLPMNASPHSGGYPPMNANYNSGGYPPLNARPNSGGYPPMNNSGGYPPMNGSNGYPPMNTSGYPPISSSTGQGYPPASSTGSNSGYPPATSASVQPTQ